MTPRTAQPGAVTAGSPAPGGPPTGRVRVRRARGLARLGPTGSLAAVATTTVLAGAAVATLPGLPAPAGGLTPPWWMIAVAFAGGQVWPLRVRLRRVTHAVPLGGLPLVVGLFALTPLGLLLARLAGAALVLALLRGRSAHRVAFDIALAGLRTALAGATVWALAGGHGVLSPRGWCAALAAVALGEAVERIVVPPPGWLQPRWREGLRGRRAAGAANPGAANPGVRRSGVRRSGVVNPGVVNPGALNPGALYPGDLNAGDLNAGALNPGLVTPAAAPAATPRAAAHAAEPRRPRLASALLPTEPAPRRRDAGDDLARGLATALAVGVTGLLLTTVLALGWEIALPAAPALLAAAIGCRLYLQGLERADGRQRLLRLSERLREAQEVDDVARLVVAHLTDLVGARHAELVIGRRGRHVGWVAGRTATDQRTPTPAPGLRVPAPAPGLLAGTPVAGLRVAAGPCDLTDPSGLPGRATDLSGLPEPADRPAFTSLFLTPADGVPLDLPPGLPAPVVDGEGVLAAAARLRLSRGAGDALADGLLAARDLQEAVVLPLTLGDGMSGALLVGERSQTLLRGYRDEEVELLRTVANQATLALRHALALERLRHEATHDQLTGLPNRQQFRRRAARAVTDAADYGPACAVGVLDLDGFRTVNDSLGHLAGDAVLAEVGRRMAVLSRAGLQICRLGGDEFAVLVRGIGGEDDAVAVARRMLDSLHAPFDVMGDQVRLTGSLGLALAPRDGVTPEQLLRNADVAMCAAKEEAGGVRVYARELAETLDAPLSLAADLRLALARGDVRIAVQPLVDLATGRLHSVEALARWRHPVLGVVNPEAFVMAAERVGLIGELTTVVIEQALGACAQWLACGLEVQVAVNLAARTLSDPDLPAQVEEALHRHGVPGRLLCLELTETGVISSPDRALAVLARLRELGVRLAVDDFGTGYSSMTYMNWLAPDQVKIDKGFVQRLRFDPRNEAIVRSIIDLAHNLGLEVVAEGVGDPGTATRLADLGCTIGQGFLFAEPMPTQDLPDWVTRWMSVPERDELPETETDPFAEDVDDAGSGPGGGAGRGADDGDRRYDVVVALGPTSGSVVLAPDRDARPATAPPRGEDGSGELRLHVVR